MRDAVLLLPLIRRSVLCTARRMGVAVLQFFLGGIAYFLDRDVEVQRLAGHRVVEVHVDRAHADLVHGDRALAAFLQRQHGGHAGLEVFGVLEILLRHTLDLAFLAFAITVGGGDRRLHVVAGGVFFQRLLQARDQLAVAEQDPQRLAVVVRAFHLRAVHAERVVQRDDLVLASLHCLSLEWVQSADSIRTPPCRTPPRAPPAPAIPTPPALRPPLRSTATWRRRSRRRAGARSRPARWR